LDALLKSFSQWLQPRLGFGGVPGLDLQQVGGPFSPSLQPAASVCDVDFFTIISLFPKKDTGGSEVTLLTKVCLQISHVNSQSRSMKLILRRFSVLGNPIELNWASYQDLIVI